MFDPISDKAALIHRLIQFNNIESALERLDIYATQLDQEDKDYITMLKANYYDWLENSNYTGRTRSTEDLQLQINRIKKAILDFTQKLL